MHFKKKNRYFEWYNKLVYAGPKSARNIWTNLSSNPARLATMATHQPIGGT